MMKNKNTLYGLVLLASVFVTGCKAPQLTQEEKLVVPETYGQASNDSTTIATLSWQQFFQDTILQTYIRQALTNNHSFRQTVERVRMAQNQLMRAKGGLLPNISAGLGAGVQRFGEYSMDGVGNSTTNTPDLEKEKHIPDPYSDFTLGIQFEWEADIWGKLSHKKQAAAARWMASQEAARYAQTLLISELATQYYELIGLDRQKEIIKVAIQNTEDSYKLTYELKQEGEVTQLGVDQFESRLLQLRGLLLENEQQIEEKERAISSLIGSYPTEIRRISFREMEDLQFPTEVGVPSQLIYNRPDIRSAEQELLASKADSEAARKAFFPSLTLNVGGGFNAFDVSHWFTAPASLIYNLGAGLTAPIFKQHEIKALWNDAQSAQRIALLQYQEKALKAYEEIVNLIRSHDNLLKRNKLKKEERKLHARSVSDANELFKLSFIGYLEVLSTDEKYMECELDYTSLCTRHCINQVLLYRALGGGTL